MEEFLAPPKAPLLGELLLSRGLVHTEALKAALEQQAIFKLPLGQILLHNGALSALSLQKVLAEQQSQPFVDIEATPVDASLLDKTRIHEYLHWQTLPWQMDEDGTIWFASVKLDEGVRDWAQSLFPANRVAFAHFTLRDLRESLQRCVGDTLTQRALEHLWQTTPEFSARQVLSIRQKIIAAIALAAGIAGAWLHPAETWHGFWWFCLFFFNAYLLFKWLLWMRGQRHFPTLEKRLDQLPDVAEADLPTYTLLVPLYKEERSIPRLVQALEDLDYPRAKLDIKLILEADDDMTWQAIRAQKPSGMFDVIRVPPSEPRTKPKACNYALWFAKGEMVTIYDAEDAPHPRQLKDAAKMFAHARHDGLGCVQAQLNYYNRPKNWLTQCFSLEYALWFDALLPALQQLHMPLPLGGTSNHLPRDLLESLGAWDPYNVTEDADLGLRLAARGLRTEVLPSLTLEEAPSRFSIWLKQRTRWIKGYMMTYAVHMRHPLRLLKQMGWRGFLGVQLFIGVPCLAFFLGPLAICLGLVSGWILTIPPLLNTLLWLTFFWHIVVHLMVSTTLLKRLGWTNMAVATLTFPAYWFLHSLACLRAVWQLVCAPHIWEKTPHAQDSDD